MKKWFAAALLLMLLVPCLASAQSMVVHITTASLDAAEIGENWTAAYTLDGYELTDGALFDVPMGQITLAAELVENDSRPDVGAAENVYNMTANRLEKGATFYQTVYVTENSGSHRNQQISWTIEYDFIPVYGYVLN